MQREDFYLAFRHRYGIKCYHNNSFLPYTEIPENTRHKLVIHDVDGALEIAASQGKLELVRQLLGMGATVVIDAYERAKQMGKHNVASYLEKYINQESVPIENGWFDMFNDNVA